MNGLHENQGGVQAKAILSSSDDKLNNVMCWIRHIISTIHVRWETLWIDLTQKSCSCRFIVNKIPHTWKLRTENSHAEGVLRDEYVFSNRSIISQSMKANMMEELSIANHHLKTASDSFDQDYEAQITKLDIKRKTTSQSDWTSSIERNLILYNLI